MLTLLFLDFQFQVLAEDFLSLIPTEHKYFSSHQPLTIVFGYFGQMFIPFTTGQCSILELTLSYIIPTLEVNCFSSCLISYVFPQIQTQLSKIPLDTVMCMRCSSNFIFLKTYQDLLKCPHRLTPICTHCSHSGLPLHHYKFPSFLYPVLIPCFLYPTAQWL